MSTDYAGDSGLFPGTVPVPDDGDPPDAASVGVALEGLADRTMNLDLRVEDHDSRINTIEDAVLMGTVTSDGSGNMVVSSGTGFTVADGITVTRVTFTTPRSGATYFASGSVIGGAGYYLCNVHARNASYVEFFVQDHAGVTRDSTNHAYSIAFYVRDLP